MRTEELIRAEIDRIDWEAVSDESRLRDIGHELFDVSQRYDGLGVPDAVALVACLIDGFETSRPKYLRVEAGNLIARGLARVLMLDRAPTLES